MNVVELWNTCADWFPATTIVINSDGGDHLKTFEAVEDCLKFCGKNTVSAFSVNTLEDIITVEIEV